MVIALETVMLKWKKRLAPLGLLGFLLVGPGECNPEASSFGPSGALRPAKGGNPVGATDPDGDPSHPRIQQTIQRPAR
jgi:hypothetical protein